MLPRPVESRSDLIGGSQHKRRDDVLGGAGSAGGVGFFGPHASGDLKRKPAKPRRDFHKKR